MADWPPVATPQATPSPQEREKTYLMLVDMFVDIVEPNIIQMVLQNRNWDVDAALEDIMILTNSSQSHATQNGNKTKTSETHSHLKSKRNANTTVRNESVPSNKFISPQSTGKVFAKQQANLQSRPKKQMVDKPKKYEVPDMKQENHLQIQPFIDQYNYVKSTKIPFDRAVMLIRDGVKVMIILRGPPGSGKSYLARKLLLDCGIEPSAHKRHIFSTDEFFVQRNVYVFVPEFLSQAHLWNQRSVAAAIRDEVSPVIVDNTNTQAWEMQVYAEMAVMAGYDMEILEPDTPWFNRDGVLAKRNVHGVPKAKIRQMIERYERNITPDKLMKQFNLRYSLLKAPPQLARNCKWRDKLSNQRNNKPKKKKNDSSVKSSGNLDNLNTTFQTWQLNSPSFSQVDNDFTVRSTSEPNFSFPFQVTSNEITEEKNKIFSNETRFEEGGNNSSSCENGESNRCANVDESDANTMFANMMKNSTKFFESFGGSARSSQGAAKIPEQSSSGIPQGHNFQQAKYSFDFMAETNKLLDALNRPSLSHSKVLGVDSEPSKTVHRQETMKTVNSSSIDVPGNILLCKESEIFLPDKQIPSGEDVLFSEGKESNVHSEDKVKVAQDLVHSIIGKAVKDSNGSKSFESVTSAVVGDRGLLWDYVIVNGDKTFTYQRKNSIPFGLPVVITDDMNFKYMDVTGDTSYVGETGQQRETKNGNMSKTAFDVSFNVPERGHKSLVPESKIGSEDLKLPTHKADSSSEKPNIRLSVYETLLRGNNPSFSDTTEECYIHSGRVSEEVAPDCQFAMDSRSNNANVPKKETFCTLEPLDDNHTLSGNNVTSSQLDTKTSNISESLKPLNLDKFGKPSVTPAEDSYRNWNVAGDWDFNKNATFETSQSKPPRNLRRPKLLSNIVTNQFVDTKLLGNWDTISNAADTWVLDGPIQPSKTREGTSPLPQRFSPQRTKTNRIMVDSSTNTYYLDFSLIADGNLTGLKVLTGNLNNVFPDNPETVQNIAETLFLHKSTMTGDEITSCEPCFDITQITSLFPNIPEKYILDVVKKCHGDMNWAVDLLLDSEHNMALYGGESEGDSSDSGSDDEMELDQNQFENVGSQNTQDKTSPKREPKNPTDEQTELKKLLENSVVFDKSHYSDKILKVLKRKHPEYVHLIENSPPKEDINNGKVGTSEGSPGEVETEGEDGENEEESNSSGGCEVETEDDTLALIMTNDLILQLQQKFGTSSVPKISDVTPVVKLPVSFARQLFGYVMDSLQSDMEEQQYLIENMIAKDEEVARLLQFQDEDSRPQLQEVMDMEVALAVHRAEQEEWKNKGNETLAAKMSKNILVEKFPHVDPKMLAEVLQAHNYSLSDTIDSLTLGLGIDPEPTSEKTTQEPPKEEWEKITTIIVSDEIGATGPAASGANPVSEAEAHRAQAASYYSLRMDCLNKAHDAFRTGNKTVATYYSQIALRHKEGMEQSNSKAAACLFSSHKTGNNTLDLHFLHVREAEVVLDMFLDEVVTDISEHNKRHQNVFLITGRGLRSVGGVSRIKPMVQRKLQARGIPYNEVNPGMLSALVRNVTPLSYTL